MNLTKISTRLWTWFQLEEKLWCTIRRISGKRKEYFHLIWPFSLDAFRRACSNKLLCLSFRVFLRDTTARYSHMDKQELERHTLWKGLKLNRNRKVSFLELFSISSMLSMVLLEFSFWSRSLCSNFTTKKSSICSNKIIKSYKFMRTKTKASMWKT